MKAIYIFSCVAFAIGSFSAGTISALMARHVDLQKYIAWKRNPTAGIRWWLPQECYDETGRHFFFWRTRAILLGILSLLAIIALHGLRQ